MPPASPKLVRYLQRLNPEITQEQADFLVGAMSTRDLCLLKFELDTRKLDDLLCCLADIEDVDEITPAKVTYYGINFYDIPIAFPK